MKRTIYLLVTCNLMERTLQVNDYEQVSTARNIAAKRHTFDRDDLNTVNYDKNMRTVTYDKYLNCVMISRIVRKEL